MRPQGSTLSLLHAGSVPSYLLGLAKKAGATIEGENFLANTICSSTQDNGVMFGVVAV